MLTLIWRVEQFAQGNCVSRLATASKHLSSLGSRRAPLRKRKKVALPLAEIDLSRTSDFLGGVIEHLLPLSNPPCRPRDREENGEPGLGGEARRLECCYGVIADEAVLRLGSLARPTPAWLANAMLITL